ncbi:MAG: hypothetical protein IKW86_02720 [Salinivirgaceae bacterium]|nr:hypothetical protein [Salinivirgaceae bacterium]
MKKLLSTLMLIALSAIVTTGAMAQNSFSYQSVIRNNGEVVSNQDVALLISILNGSDVCYQEVQKVKTNAYGNISVNVGEGEPKTGSFAAIPWETMQIMMQIEVSTDGTDNYVNLGQMQIQPVPYTMYAASTTTVIQPKEASEDPIFEVRDSEGNLMFAVYETGVKVFVDNNDNTKAAKSKFAVAGHSVSKDDEDLLTIDAAGTTVYVDDNDNTKAAKSKFAVAEQSGKDVNNLLTIDGSGATIFVDNNTNTDANKAAKSRFAVAGQSGKDGKNLLTIDTEGTTVFVDDNADTKAAKSRFAVAGQSGKDVNNLLTIDGSGSTIYVDDNADTKAAKSRFAVAGQSGGKANGNLFTIDGDGSTVYVDFNTSDKAAKSKFAVAGQSGKGIENALTIDGDQATFYIDVDDNAKAAKSRFAVAGVGANKDVQTAFVVDGSGTTIYIDEWDNASKAAKSTFAVAGLSAQKGNSNFFIIHRDSTRIYVNDLPQTADTSGTTPVVAPSLASAFAVIGMTQKTDMLVVNRDSTIVRMNTYIADEIQSATGEVEKIVDDKVAAKVYSTGKIEPYFSGEYFTITIFYAYYHSELGEYLYLKYIDEGWDGSTRYEYRNYWLVDGIIYRDTTYFALDSDQEPPVPIYEIDKNWEESYMLPQEWSGKGILTILESEMKAAGYKLKCIDSVDYYYDKEEDMQVMESKRNTVTSLGKPKLFLNNLPVLTSLVEPASVFIHSQGNDTAKFDEDNLLNITWDSENGYALLDNNVNADNIVAAEKEKDNELEADDERVVFESKREYRKHTLEEIENMLVALKNGFAVTATANNPAYGSVQLSANKERYSYGETITLTPVIDNHIFIGWSDGCTDTVRTVCVMGDASYTAVFEEPVLYVSGDANVNDENYGFVAEKPLASISDAIEKINQFGNADSKLDWTIIVLDTLTEPQTIQDMKIQGDVSVTTPICANHITIMGNEANGNAVLCGLYDGENETEMGGALLSITTSVPVTIKNLTIMGGCTQNADGSGISIAKGCKVTLDNGVVVAMNKGFNGCGGVCVTGSETEKSTLTIANGCQITNNNTNNVGGGVKVNGYAELIMTGGEISGNSTGMYQGGGVYVDKNAKFTMSGGDIISNTAGGNGGGVYLNGNTSGATAEFVMSGGTISGNSCGEVWNGSGIFINGLSYFASLKMSESATVTDDIYFAPTIISFDKSFNDNIDDEGFEYIEVASDSEFVPYTIVYAESGVELTGTIDGNQFSGPQNGELMMGKHTLVATIKKGDYAGLTITKKVNVVKSLAAASFEFDKEFNEGKDNDDFEYVEVASGIETVPFTITSDENDVELYGVIDDFSFSGTFSGILEIGEHTLIATVHKDNYTDKTVVRKIKVVKTLDYASITFGIASNGNIDDEDFEYIEVGSTNETVPYTISSENGTTLTCSITKNEQNFSDEPSGELAIGSYIIDATVHKDYYGDVTVTKKIKVVKSLSAPSITVGNDDNWFEYIEVASDDEKVPYTINSTESGATLTGYVGEVSFEGAKSGELAVGSYTITATVRKDNYNEVTVTRNINVVVALQGASFLFGKAFNGYKDAQDNEYIEVASNSDVVSYTIKSIENGVTLTGSVDGTSFTGTKNGTLSVGQHTLTATISKENLADVTVTKKVTIVKSLTAASFSFGKEFNGHQDSNGFEYIEVASNSENVSYSVASGESGVSIACTINGSTVANSGTLSVGEHTIVATVHKDYYTDVVVTKKVKVVKSLIAATFTFGKQSNGNTDSNGYEYFEVSSSSGTISYTIANPNSENGVSLSGTVDGTKYNGPKSGELSVGSHTLIATIHIDNQTDVVVTKKIMVVKTLAPASISFGKAFSGYSANGFDYIEVASNSTTVSYSITTSESGASIVSTINNSSVANSGNLAIGEHTIQVTVRKNCYTDVTVTKKVKVVRELQEPTINFSSDYNASFGNGTSENSNYTSGKGYLVKDVSLKNDGTGYLNYSFSSSDNATITITTENGSGISTSGKLNIGPHTLTVTVAKSLYGTKTFTKKIYIQGTLNDATISSSNGTNTSGNNWQFSYLRYNDMSVSVSVGNTGNSISVTAGGSSKGTSFSLSHGFSGNIVVTQTRQYCKTKTTTKTMNVTIKPVTWKVGDCCLYYDADDSGSECEIYGTVYLGKNGSYNELRSFSNVNFALKAWDCFNHANLSFTLTSPSDYICYKSEDMKEDDVTKWDEIGEVSRDVTLETLADWERNNNGVYFTVWNSSGDSMGHRIYYTISD